MTSKQKSVLFSGAQPTGNGATLGTLLGALKNWVLLQTEYDCLFSIVDLHALTMKQDAASLREKTYRLLATYLACGVDPHKSIVFVQSHVPCHAQLGWILTCYTYMGELSRMTQFKDKSQKAQNIGAGLFTYPSLMAADILLYQAKLVPVGQDQKQHLELARDLAQRLNHQSNENLFTVPEVFIPKQGARVMSLADPESKMSKSDLDEAGTIYIDDSNDLIVKKFKRAVTDSLNKIAWNDEQPGIKNLLQIESAITGIAPEALLQEMDGKQYGYLKGRVADSVVSLIQPIRDEQNRLLADLTYLNKILKDNAERATALAKQTLTRVHTALGLVPAE